MSSLKKGPIVLFAFSVLLLPRAAVARHRIVSLSPGALAAIRVAGKRSDAGIAGLRHLPAVDLYLADEKDREVVRALEEAGAVEEIEEEGEITIEASSPFPNDPMLADQGWITEGPDISAAEAWTFTKGSDTVTVALIDTGIDRDHEDLKGNLWTNPGEVAGNGVDDDENGYVDDIHGYNFRNETSDTQDENGHGSHLAGIVGAIGDNGIGVAGVNWSVRLMPLKFTDAAGKGSTTAAIEAIDYAIRNGADLINASWTVRLQGETDGNGLLKKAIQKAGDAGILFVTAAGNQFESGEGTDIDEEPVYPARYDLDNLVTVAALAEDGTLAPFSNYGPSSVHLAAPGSGILSTVSDGGYGSLNGTSIATAFVSGAAALLLSIQGDLTPLQIRDLLREGGREAEALKGYVRGGQALDLGRSAAILTHQPLPRISSEEEQPESPEPPEPEDKNTTSLQGGCSLVP